MQCNPVRELGRFEAPNGDVAGGLVFTPDGTRLTYFTGDAVPSLRVWDLPAIAEQLEKLGLGWDQLPYKSVPVPRRPGSRLTVEIDEGALKPRRLNVDAWHLVTGPSSERDPVKALELSREAVKLEPANVLYLNTLGVAEYRNGLFKEAIGTLEKSLAAGRGQSDAFDLYFLAMCHARLGDPPNAQDCFDRAARCVAQQMNLSSQFADELKQFRAEAEVVMKKGTDPMGIRDGESDGAPVSCS